MRRAFILLIVAIQLFYAYPAGALNPRVQKTSVSVQILVEKVTDDSKPSTGVGGTIEYTFYPTYVLGAKFSYAGAQSEIAEYFARSMNDASIFLRANELVRDRDDDITVSGTLGLVGPTSLASKESSMYWGVTEELAVKKGWPRRLATSYILSAAQYDYKYITAVENDDKVIYNVRYTMTNKAVFSWEPTTWMQLRAGGFVQTYTDLSPQTYNIYNLSFGVEVALIKSASFSFEINSYKKDSKVNETWSGPPTSSEFFGAKGTVFRVASTIHF